MQAYIRLIFNNFPPVKSSSLPPPFSPFVTPRTLEPMNCLLTIRGQHFGQWIAFLQLRVSTWANKLSSYNYASALEPMNCALTTPCHCCWPMESLLYNAEPLEPLERLLRDHSRPINCLLLKTPTSFAPFSQSEVSFQKFPPIEELLSSHTCQRLSAHHHLLSGKAISNAIRGWKMQWQLLTVIF